MSTIVCRQDSSHPHLLESTTLRLKLVAPEPEPPPPAATTTLFESLLRSLYTHNQNETPYVHPLVRHSSALKLSQESLELCTESLGSETGSECGVFAFPASGSPAARSRREHVAESKKAASRRFPPPLTTMSGSRVFQVRPHREGGRLIIEAMEAPMSNGCFQAERSDGRLRLTCWTGWSEGNCVEDVEAAEEMGRSGGGGGGDGDGEKFQRPRRCKEDGHGDNKGRIRCNWEPCWVATS